MTKDVDQSVISFRDCKETLLSKPEWPSSADYGLFHFTQQRTLGSPELFADCTFADLYINDKTDWGAPIPSTFQAFFEDIIRVLLPSGHKLILNVVDLYEGYFDPGELVKSVLEPNSLLYFYLEKEIGGQKHLTLFFECPLESLNKVTNEVFSSSLIDVDGFIMAKPKVELFEQWVNEGNTDVMFRELLREVYLAFAVWGDHNGLFIATDKLAISDLRKVFDQSGLEAQIRAYLAAQQ